jgi:hypothetical protein
MRPKPTREWVMLELERLNVRVVSGRSAKDDEYAEDSDPASMGMLNAPHNADPNMVGRRGSITASLLNAADIARGNGAGPEWQNGGQNRSHSFKHGMNQGRNSVPLQGDPTRVQDDKKSEPPHRPLVGGGSAAAYEAARADHYRELAEKKSKDHNHSGGEMVRSNGSGAMSNLAGSMGKNGAISNGGGGVLGGLSINANQHYDMLKLHHMNLLNEIQETTLMMNIYQQQQLQQQQQQEEMEIQHMQDDQYSNDMSEKHGNYGHVRRDSSASGGSDGPNEIPQNHDGEPVPASSSSSGSKANMPNHHRPKIMPSHDDNDRENQLAKIKEEIEDRKRMLEKLSAGNGPASKRSKTS